MKIECRDKSIHELLQSNFYTIPNFQRPYSWEKQNIEDFWEDIVGGSGDECEDDEYFIGSMVMYPHGNEKIAIVDGQQRLTTSIIFLCAIRNFFNHLNLKEQAESLHSIYIEKRHRDTQKYFTLDPGTSFPYFHNFIMSYPEVTRPKIEAGSEEKCLHDCFNMLCEKIEGTLLTIDVNPQITDALKPTKKKEKLVELREKLLNVKVVYIQLETYIDAFTVFETLNTRGLDLKLSHLVKNHITRILSPENPRTDLVSQDWDKINETLEQKNPEVNFDQFLHHFWISRYNYITKQKLFRELAKKTQTKEQAETLLNFIRTDASIYKLIHDPSFTEIDLISFDREIRAALYAISLFKASMPYPTLMSIIRSMQERKLKPSGAYYCLSKIENYHYIMTAITSQRSSGGTSLMYTKAAQQFSKATKEEIPDIIKGLQGKLKKIPSYEEFELAFLELSYSNKNTKKKKLIKYTLAKLYQKFTRGYLDINSLTIEHLIPQKKTSNGFSENIIGMLGNLILVTENLNNELDDKTFEEKMKILKQNNDPILEDGYIANQNTFNEEQVINRTKHLAKLAYEKVWKI